MGAALAAFATPEDDQAYALLMLPLSDLTFAAAHGALLKLASRWC